MLKKWPQGGVWRVNGPKIGECTVKREKEIIYKFMAFLCMEADHKGPVLNGGKLLVISWHIIRKR